MPSRNHTNCTSRASFPLSASGPGPPSTTGAAVGLHPRRVPYSESNDADPSEVNSATLTRRSRSVARRGFRGQQWRCVWPLAAPARGDTMGRTVQRHSKQCRLTTNQTTAPRTGGGGRGQTDTGPNAAPQTGGAG